MYAYTFELLVLTALLTSVSLSKNMFFARLTRPDLSGRGGFSLK